MLDEHCLYSVGSSTERKDWRDVDVVCIMDDDKFYEMFPQGGDGIDMKWHGYCIAISCWGQRVTGLPIDFKIQGQTMANEAHKGRREAIGLSCFNTTIPDSFKHKRKPKEEQP